MAGGRAVSPTVERNCPFGPCPQPSIGPFRVGCGFKNKPLRVLFPRVRGRFSPGLRLLNCKSPWQSIGISAPKPMPQLVQPVQVPQESLSPSLGSAALWRLLVLIGLIVWLYGAVLAR